MKKIKLSTTILIFILLSYSIISFYKLGNTKNPQTYVNLKEGEQLTFKINTDQIPEKIMIYVANAETNASIFFADEFEQFDKYVYDTYFDVDFSSIFQWKEIYINVNGIQSNYIMFQSNLDSSVIGELKIYDNENNEIPLTPMGEKEKLLLDEQEYVPEKYSYMNSSYFDEIYFPRASYEILNNLSIMEYVHPPLGKLIISIPMYFLGVTPFVYRLCGNIAGILMILIIYLISKQLFKRERYALFAAAIMALDGMHFVQTRIGTVDSFLVVFCLTSFLFFLKFIKIPSEENLKKKMIPLLLSGTFWGMAMSVKWTASFVGLGMGIIYLVKFIKHKKLDIKLLGWSVLSFIIVPIVIYVASYIPIMNNPNAKVYYEKTNKSGEAEGVYVQIHDIKSFFEYQHAMYKYHSELQAEHPYSSPWYTWPIMKRPLWFYIGRFDDGTVGTIACMGNPGIWWLSIGTAIFTLIYSIIKRDKKGLMIIIMIITTWLSYAAIGRIMYIYHYFITLPFMMLTIVFTISRLSKWKPKIDYAIPILTLIFLGFFIYFYPVYSGRPVELERIQNTEWFDSWEYDGVAR